jgi:hypothetical protein
MPSRKEGPDDHTDSIWIASVGPIPIGSDDDPRHEDFRRLRHDARVIAQALHTAEELLAGLSHENAWVRFESVPRSVARWGDDPRVEERLREIIGSDAFPAVRQQAVMAMLDYEPGLESTKAVLSQKGHSDPDVREAVDYVLAQWGLMDPRAGQP